MYQIPHCRKREPQCSTGNFFVRGMKGAVPELGGSAELCHICANGKSEKELALFKFRSGTPLGSGTTATFFFSSEMRVGKEPSVFCTLPQPEPAKKDRLKTVNWRSTAFHCGGSLGRQNAFFYFFNNVDALRMHFYEQEALVEFRELGSARV